MTKYRVAADMAPFEGKDDVSFADRRSADLLKEMFRQHLPKMEDMNDEHVGDA